MDNDAPNSYGVCYDISYGVCYNISEKNERMQKLPSQSDIESRSKLSSRP